jgi:UDP-glucuronate 4-epimerase
MSETVLVTGVAGFIGSHVAEAFAARGWRVTGVDNFDPFYDREAKLRNLTALPRDRFELVEHDVCDGAAMRDLVTRVQPALIVHLAALAGVRPSLAAPARFVKVNVDGLTSVLEAARAAECSNILFASSSSVYGNQSTVPFAETDPADAPISPYAATKRAGEMLCHTYAHLFGMRIACLRFFTVYGPRQRPDLAISAFMHKLLADKEIPMFGDGSTSRDYTFIDDIIRGVTAAADHVRAQQQRFCRTYNLGGSHPITLRELIAGIGEVAGIEPRVRQLPMQPGDVQRTFADLARSRTELGYAPTTELRTGLERQWQWITAQHAVTTSRH